MFCPRCHRLYDDPATQFCPPDGAPIARSRRIQGIRTQPAREAGTLIDGRYSIRGLLGKGSMSRVFLAEDTVTGEPVAVKILDQDMARRRALRERFLREIDVARKLGHPNIGRILGAGERADRSP